VEIRSCHVYFIGAALTGLSVHSPGCTELRHPICSKGGCLATRNRGSDTVSGLGGASVLASPLAPPSVPVPGSTA
jgi:hypothetical protein